MDVAREAGVSQATVSMVLNKKYNVTFSDQSLLCDVTSRD